MAERMRIVDPRKGDAILKSATALFPKLGFEKTTMDAIALHAGVTKQTVYSHFASKEQLFITLIDNLCKTAILQPPIAGARHKPFEALLYEAGINVLTLITSADGMAVTRLVVAESGRYPKLAKLYYQSGTQRIVQLIASFLEEQSARGIIAIPNTQSAAAYFFALLKGQYFLRMTLGVPPLPTLAEKRAHVKEVVAMFIRLYGEQHPMHTTSSL